MLMLDGAESRWIRLTPQNRISMNTPLVHVLPLAALALLAVPAQAATVWSEGVNGDLSTNEGAPTSVAFSIGSNVVTGSVISTTDVRDYFTFTIGAGQALSSIILLAYDDPSTGTANDGNTGFNAINIGSTSLMPGAGNIGSFLGANHLTPSIGTDILPGLGNAGFGAAGFTGSLGPGTYTYVIQQTSPVTSAYSLQFNVVPEPSSLLLSLAGAGLVFRRRR